MHKRYTTNVWKTHTQRITKWYIKTPLRFRVTKKIEGLTSQQRTLRWTPAEAAQDAATFCAFNEEC
jgi:hypothetical protein